MGQIAEMFNTSPFEPLLHHLEKVRECVSLVRPMLEAMEGKRYEELEAITQQVFKAEHEADGIKDEIRQQIPRNFFIPVYRGDLLGYLKLQDDMADSAEDIAFLLTLKNLELPPSLSPGLKDYVDSVMRVCERVYEMNERLRDLVSKGFHAESASDLFDLIRTVEKAESEADKAQYGLSKSLFALEDEMKPADLMLWWRVFLELGQLANYSEKTSDRLRRMLSS